VTTYAFPTAASGFLPYPSGYQFGQRSNTMLHTSPLSGNIQTIELPGARWCVSIVYTNLIEPNIGILEAFLAQLRGQANRVTLFDIVKPMPTGTMQGTMTVNGSITAGATTCTVTAAGQTAKTLLRGDKLNIGGELKVIVADATSDGSGNIALTVEPPFRGTIVNGASVVWNQPTALFLPQAPEWKRTGAQGNWSSYTFDFVETFA